ncbi:GyrI-like domain-containing protein [uncultured Cyclobacterium sp.]|uniref:GyrI-like domain-containing protein n=1 Tax=uncultured Cyclobacterium sp. TaxID=453820 RepID=UPI0030EB24C8|tara:strand:- start:26680 stop:27156 length:477 start_codon:yes stop_codon:yes gene_type:complete
MQARIVNSKDKQLVGKSCRMSLVNNRTAKLWKSFITIKATIPNLKSQELIALQVYDRDHFASFDPTKEFDQWACIEVEDLTEIPDDFTALSLKGGLYAVFNYKGPSIDKSIFEYIYCTWVPQYDYQLDDRPHFQVMGDKYSNSSPLSEEEIWIPLKNK